MNGDDLLAFHAHIGALVRQSNEQTMTIMQLQKRVAELEAELAAQVKPGGD